MVLSPDDKRVTQADAAARAAQRGNMGELWGLWIPNLTASIAALIMMLTGAKKLRPAYTAYFLAYFAVACGATWLLSSPRYLTACIPLMLAAANASGERRTDIAMTAACTMMQAAYLYMYVNGYYVY